jgi:predicted dehydrogenase
MLRVGIIGSGVGIRTHAPGFAQTGGADVTALFSPNHAQKRAEEFGIRNAYSSYQAVCEDPEVDLVVIASPNIYHLEQVTYALDCGKHVLCEKPLATTTPDAKSLVSKSKEHPKQFAGVNHQLRFSPYFREIRRIIRSGELGQVFHARIFQQGMSGSDLNAPWSWSFDSEGGGGVRWAMGSHLVDLSGFLFGSSVSSVAGALHTVVPTRQREGVAVSVSTSLEFSGAMTLVTGVQVLISAVAAAHSGFKFEIDVFLEKGEIHFDLEDKVVVYSERGARIERLRDPEGLKDGEISNEVPFFAGSFRYYADEIVSCLTQSGVSEVSDAATFQEALETTRILEAFLESYRMASSATLRPADYDRSSI